MRDLGTYYRIKALKLPFAVVLSFTGYAVAISCVLSRSIGYFEEFSAIACEIVQAHGGSIHAASEDGIMTFTIELP